ncbi:hypothetical protein NDU88_003262 [Pleurodeles waltl]|uniref:Uncharacterized protein n=1 Tax=Pleurodeles waltl TaxID=8319 RepID=A0AAV7LRM6_PLEWA|nr:hypothetical protein NDU88_003262 [Pleurodeles waltl]
MLDSMFSPKCVSSSASLKRIGAGLRGAGSTYSQTQAFLMGSERKSEWAPAWAQTRYRILGAAVGAWHKHRAASAALENMAQTTLCYSWLALYR